MFEDLARLRELASIPKLSREQKAEAAQIAFRLREAGYINDEISRMTGGKWKPRTIKGYTRGAKVMDTTEKDALFAILSDMLSQKKTLDDVDAYLRANAALKPRHTSIEEIQKLDEEAAKSTSIPELTLLQIEISKTDYTVPDLVYLLETLQTLADHGFEKKALILLKTAAEKYGEPAKVLEAIVTFIDLEDLKNHHDFMLQLIAKARTEVTAEEARKNRVYAEALIYQTYVDIAKDLVQKHSFDLNSLGELVKACEKFGRPFEVLESLNSNQNLQSIRADTETEKLRLGEAKEQHIQKQNELVALEDEITNAKVTIGGIETDLDRIETVQIISDMIAKPDDVNLTMDKFLQVAAAMMNSIVLILETKPTLQGNWSRSIKRDARSLRDDIAAQVRTG